MLETGIKFKKSETVETENTAAAMGSGMLPVYATPAMILLLESTCAQSVAPELEEGMTTVGTKLDIEHVSATPIGMEVTCESELTLIDRRRLVFKVEIYDKAGIVGRGTHERFIVASNKFMEKVSAKSQA